MADSKAGATTDPIHAELTAALVTIARRDTFAPVDSELFGVEGVDGFRDEARDILRMSFPSRPQAALENALAGILDPEESRPLGERRKSFMHHYGVSLSTTIRLERQGAELFAGLWIKNVLAINSDWEDESEEQDDTPELEKPGYRLGWSDHPGETREELVNRINHLEAQVRMYRKALYDINSTIAGLAPYER
ncbi:hypothetical protein G6024_01025 [Dietzia maris]|nr:hypothetical protein [Dietzia maris]MBB0995704.1 hypothetical protein [Dietzia maris]